MHFGLQIALAFYFINLLDFHVQTDLTIARDRVIGVLLGILAIGFIFDCFGPRSDAEQTRKLFTHTLPMLARLGFSSIQRDTDKAFPEIQRLPESDQRQLHQPCLADGHCAIRDWIWTL
jgi:multidrug resistance protein MdtO